MIESTPEGAEARLESFTPAERAVMAARAEAERLRRERDAAERGLADVHPVLTAMKAERDAAVRSVAALFRAYIAITPGETVEGLEPKVQAEAERLLGELIELEARHSDVLALTAPLVDENANLRAQLAETSARLAAITRQATAAGPVLEAAEAETDAEDAWAAAGYPEREIGTNGPLARMGDAGRARRRAVAALRAAREGK